MPHEMTFGGLNCDVVTGASALVLAVAAYGGKAPRSVVTAWNVTGAVLLAVVGVAFAATPVVQAFGPEHVNRWVLYFPYVWLPTVLVQAALFGHLVVFRRLGAERRKSPVHGFGLRYPRILLVADAEGVGRQEQRQRRRHREAHEAERARRASAGHGADRERRHGQAEPPEPSERFLPA